MHSHCRPELNEAKERIIAKHQNTFAKRQREVAKKAKAEAKRMRRNERKHAPAPETPPEFLVGDHPTHDGDG